MLKTITAVIGTKVPIDPRQVVSVREEDLQVGLNLQQIHNYDVLFLIIVHASILVYMVNNKR